MSLPRLYTALITPFNQDETIDYISLNNLVLDHLKKQILFVLFGTTGECPTLSHEDRAAILLYVTNILEPFPEFKSNIMIGVGGNNTLECITNVKQAKKYGYSLFMVTTPYYNKPSQQGMQEHFIKIGRTFNNDRFIMYNVPGRTNVNLLPESVKLITDSSKNYIGIKEASGNLSQMVKIIKLTNNIKNFMLFCGDDSLLIPAMSIGAHGLISVASNVIPTIMNNICHKWNEDYYKKIWIDLNGFFETLFVEPNPTPIKYICLQFNKIKSDTVRLPLIKVQSSKLISDLNEYSYQIKNFD